MLLRRTPVTAGLSSLYTGLVAYWGLDETSGDRADSTIVGNTLTDTNTVTSAAGKQGNAAQFAAGSSEKLGIADNIWLSMGDIDFAIGLWFQITDVSALRHIFAKSNTALLFEYRLRYNNGSGRIEWRVSGAGTAETSLVSGVLSADTWYFVFVWHDATNNVIGMRVDDGADGTAAHTTGVANGINDFILGGQMAGTQYFTGLIDEVAVWKNYIPTTDERAWLYNSGAGRTFTEIYNYR